MDSKRALKLPAPVICSGSHTKTPVVAALDDFNKQSGSVFHWLGKDLQQVAVFVIVHENIKGFKRVHGLLDFGHRLFQLLAQVDVVRFGAGEELNATFAQSRHCSNDVIRTQSDVLLDRIGSLLGLLRRRGSRRTLESETFSCPLQVH